MICQTPSGNSPFTHNCRMWIAYSQHLIAPPNPEQERYLASLVMGGQHHDLSVRRPILKGCRGCHSASKRGSMLTMKPVHSSSRSLESRGGISVRENPLRSLHWHLPQEVAMMASGSWWETDYAACCWAGARCKQQRLRRNVEEIAKWPPIQCHHIHDPHEWSPWEHEGQRTYPSKEEAEYTAPLCFAIAVACSWWAVRTGRAVLHVPRGPSFETVGRRDTWLTLDSRALRSWAMTPLAISLGLEPLDAAEKSRLPQRNRVSECLQSDGTLPEHHIYVGQGSHKHRLTTTKWKSPWVAGHSCTHDEWLPLYVAHICGGPLWESLPELLGCTLVCDCPWQSGCEVDILAGLCF